MRVAVVGIGKLGAPLAAVLASKGLEVVGADVSSRTVQLLNEGVAPVDEPGLQELISEHRARLTATSDLADATRSCDATILLVPTPSDEHGAFTNAFLLAAIDELGAGLVGGEAYHLVIVSSTVMPGSCDGEIRTALERVSGRRIGSSLGLCYSPEFVALGDVIANMLAPDVVLIGESDPTAGGMLERLYRGLVENDPPFRRMSLINAELTKIAVNTYVTMKISYANMLADLCERLPGADVDVVTDALGLDSRIGRKYLRGGVAYGGPCFPRDTKAFSALARTVGSEPLLAEATDSLNVSRTERLAAIVRELLGPDQVVGILGLAYKPDTAVIDESPGVELARLLAEDGFEVHVFDPVATDVAIAALGGAATGHDSAAGVVARADVVVITTPWPEFAAIPAEAFERDGRRPVLIDCWGTMPGEGYDGAVDIIRLGRAREQRTDPGRLDAYVAD
jgi:UDPglucose 6-dehydrogenase